jgi:hypothetical protein
MTLLTDNQSPRAGRGPADFVLLRYELPVSLSAATFLPSVVVAAG